MLKGKKTIFFTESCEISVTIKELVEFVIPGNSFHLTVAYCAQERVLV